MRKIHARVMGGMHLVNLKPNKYVCVAGGGGGGNGEGGSGLGCKCARDFRNRRAFTRAAVEEHGLAWRAGMCASRKHIKRDDSFIAACETIRIMVRMCVHDDKNFNSFV